MRNVSYFQGGLCFHFHIVQSMRVVGYFFEFIELNESKNAWKILKHRKNIRRYQKVFHFNKSFSFTKKKKVFK